MGADNADPEPIFVILKVDWANLKSHQRGNQRGSMEGLSAQNERFRRGLITVIRICILCTVVAALVYMVGKSWSQLAATPFRLSEVNYLDWVGAVICYCLAMFFSSVFWYRVLHAVGQYPSFQRTVFAYFASQLGKYVPGKAMVVVMRTDIIRGENVQVGPAAASVFVETLSWIFVGSVIASALIAIQFGEHSALQATAIILALIAGFLTWPRNFQWIATKLLEYKGRNSGRFEGLTLQTMAFGWLLMTIGWCLNGLSLWLVIRGLPGTDISAGDYSLTLACVSLATVAGFVSLLPGGLGVRELVMIPLLGARFGAANAVIAAIVIRFIWLASEIISSAIIYIVLRISGARA
jgi:uncharacterized membrane protein YbhN (UPF0104 family)